VKITGNSCHLRRENLLPFVVTSDCSNCRISENKPRSWIVSDFLNVPISVTSYSIKAYRLGKGFSHIRSWVLQGCMDGKWIDLAIRYDTNELNRRYKIGVFMLTMSYSVTALNIVQTAPNHSGDDFMILANVEFFGEREYCPHFLSRLIAVILKYPLNNLDIF
jgi:hypothetical protein